MDAHMDCEERSLGNRRNGYTSKQVQPGMGEVGIHTPRDCDSRFEPEFINEFIKKRECVLADSVSDRIIGLYALGNSTRRMRGIGRVGLSGLSQHRKEMDNASLQLGANRSTIGYYISGQI